MLARLDRWLAGRKEGESAARRTSAPQKAAPTRRTKRAASVATETVGPADIDRILDKINERGYDSLTDEEKRALYEASQND